MKTITKTYHVQYRQTRRDKWQTLVFAYTTKREINNAVSRGFGTKYKYRAIERTVTTTDRVLDAKDGGKG